MEHITLFTDILPEEQERMRVCFHAREMTFRNGETIMEYSSSMKKIGLILYGRAVLNCCDAEGNQHIIDELNKDAFWGAVSSSYRFAALLCLCNGGNQSYVYRLRTCYQTL